MDRKLETAKKIARDKKIKNWESLSVSTSKNKRFSIISPSGRKIHFGLFPFSGQGTFLDHGDAKLRKNWKARHTKIENKEGKKAYLNPESPSFYSFNILW